MIHRIKSDGGTKAAPNVGDRNAGSRSIMSADGQSLDRLLTALDVAPHAFSVCRIQAGWRMTFPVFRVITVHFVLQGTGHLGVGDAEPLSFAPSSVLVIPTLQPHWVGDAGPAAGVGPAAEKCDLIGDGLIEFTAGNGTGDTLLLCAAVSALSNGVQN